MFWYLQVAAMVSKPPTQESSQQETYVKKRISWTETSLPRRKRIVWDEEPQVKSIKQRLNWKKRVQNPNIVSKTAARPKMFKSYTEMTGGYAKHGLVKSQDKDFRIITDLRLKLNRIAAESQTAATTGKPDFMDEHQPSEGDFDLRNKIQFLEGKRQDSKGNIQVDVVENILVTFGNDHKTQEVVKPRQEKLYLNQHNLDTIMIDSDDYKHYGQDQMKETMETRSDVFKTDRKVTEMGNADLKVSFKVKNSKRMKLSKALKEFQTLQAQQSACKNIGHLEETRNVKRFKRGMKSKKHVTKDSMRSMKPLQPMVKREKTKVTSTTFEQLYNKLKNKSAKDCIEMEENKKIRKAKGYREEFDSTTHGPDLKFFSDGSDDTFEPKDMNDL